MDEQDAIDPAVPRWYVIHTKPRAEKKLAQHLARIGCFWHMPSKTVVRKVQRRKVKRVLPLFPGYVFARMNAECRLEVLRTNHVVRTILIPRPRETIHQLRQLRHGVSGAADSRVLSRTFHEGDRVRVTTGPMRGTEGYVKRDGGRLLLYLNVEILGSSVEVAISPSEVERL